MSPVTLPELLQNAARNRARARVKHALRPDLASKVGFAVGATILLVGYGRHARAARLRRIEAKLDEALE